MYDKMKKLTYGLTLLLILFTSACSSTKVVNTSSNIIFIPEQHQVKKEFSSDTHLLISLLNRPVTPDQQMMLAFANTRDALQRNNPAYVNYISIRGNKVDDPMTEPSYNQNQLLIINDHHAIDVLGPQ